MYHFVLLRTFLLTRVRTWGTIPNVMKSTSSDIKLSLRRSTRKKFDRFATTRRLKLVEVADLAIDALASLPREQQDALIERREKGVASDPVAA